MTMFLRVSLLLAFLSALSVSARPHEKRWGPPSFSLGGSSWGGESSWSGSSSGSGRWPGSAGWGGWDSSDEGSNKPSLTKKSYLHYETKAQSSGICNPQDAVQYMDLSAVSPALPSPAADLSLYQVALGRGTQNYTCDLANATATPVPVGALATLFDFTCVAAKKPALLRSLARIAVNHPVPDENNTHPQVIEALLSGHHYFLDDTTPFFNMNTEYRQDGMGTLAKEDASDAPANACAGKHGTETYGAVQWLNLVGKQSKPEEEKWKAVYRLNTAGGSPPKMCSDINKASFEVPYAAEYWLFT